MKYLKNFRQMNENQKQWRSGGGLINTTDQKNDYSNKDLTSLKPLDLPIRIDTDLIVSKNNQLKNLDGCPTTVDGDFYCTDIVSANEFSLEGGPEYVNGNYDISHIRSLISLDGHPREIHGNFICKGHHSRLEADIKKLMNSNVVKGKFVTSIGNNWHI